MILKKQSKSLAAFLSMNRRPKIRVGFLPAELIFEIMSWLPVKSVLKFKSVCKLWHSITRDPEFIHTHMMRSTRYIWDVQDPDSEYTIEAFYQGLVVECLRYLLLDLRLRNPSTNRFLDLPHLTDACCTTFVMPCYVSRTRSLKIILPCRNRLNQNCSLFKIITAGVDEAWRTLHVPFTCKLTLHDRHTVLVDGVYFIAVELDGPTKVVGLPLLCLEVDSEELWTISGPNGDDSGLLIGLLNWAGKPALASRLPSPGMVCDLHVWVLEDYKKQVWAKKIIINLPLITYIPYQLSDKQLWMRNLFNKENILNYDVVSKVLTRIDAPYVSGKKLRGLATLMELKGMKPYVSENVSKNKKSSSRSWTSCCFRTKI